MKNLSSPRAISERYDAILHAAEKLFAERGYHTVSTEEIAKTAGVSKGLVHYHFSTKTDLLQILLTASLTTIADQLEVIGQADMTARAKIRATVLAYIEFGNRRLGLIQGAHLAAPGNIDSTTHTQIHALMEEEKLKLARLVEDGIARGEFRPVDSGVASNILLGAIHELIAGAALWDKRMPAERVADEVTSILCDGVSR